MDKLNIGNEKQGFLTPLKALLEETGFTDIKESNDSILLLNDLTKIEGICNVAKNADMLTPIKEVGLLNPLETVHSSKDKDDK